MGTTKQNATRIIKSLEKKNYITVVPSKKDKRAVNVMLTDTGMRSLSKNAMDGFEERIAIPDISDDELE